MDAIPVSDRTRRRLRDIAARIAKADALLVIAGDGLLAEGPDRDEALRTLSLWSRAVPAGGFVVTPDSWALFAAARFAPGRILEWYGAEQPAQHSRYADWLVNARGRRIVVLECGVGRRLTTLRRIGERVAERSTAELVRIHPAESEHDESATVLRLPVIEALRRIALAMPPEFTERCAEAMPAPSASQGGLVDVETLAREANAATLVDLGRGVVDVLFEATPSRNDTFACMEALLQAKEGWVPIPSLGGDGAPGYQFTVLACFGSPELHRLGKPGGMLLFIIGPDDDAIMTVAVARTLDVGGHLWRLLHETAQSRLTPLDCPRPPFVARRPDPDSGRHEPVQASLMNFARTASWAWLTYQAFLERTGYWPSRE